MARRQPEETRGSGTLLDAIVRGAGPFQSIEERAAGLAHLRESGADSNPGIDRYLLERLAQMGDALSTVEEEQSKLRSLIASLTAPPCFPAIFLAPAQTAGVQCAIVQTESDRRVVRLENDVEIASLIPGDEVLLSHEKNCLVAKSENPGFLTGEIASFSRGLPDGRIVVRARDEEIVVLPNAALRGVTIKPGDGIRLNRNVGLALERIEASRGEEYFIESTPSDTFCEIGGLDREIEQLKRLMTLHICHPGMAGKYRLPRKRSVLMEGPPGNGKTKVARATCNWLATLSKSGRSHFINIKPGGLNTVWYGATEQRYREVFRVAREAAAAEPDVPVVMFWDEVDAIGSHRGESVHRIDDRMLNAFMAELNGLEDRGNIVILAATNRIDSLDPALLRPGRLGDLVLHFPRPRANAARAILARHLPPDIPYSANGESSSAARDVLLDHAIAQIFSSGAEAELARLMLRDGSSRTVRAADLVSGAQLESIAQSAIERACVRDAEGGPAGIGVSDVSAAIAEFCRSVPRALTPRNARSYLHDLPTDTDVVRVDLVERKVQQPWRYRVEAA